MLQKSLSKKDPKDYEIWEKALMDAGTDTYDWTDRESIKPLIEAIKTTENAG